MPKKQAETATHEEIMDGMKVAQEAAIAIKALPNPAVRKMVLKLLAMLKEYSADA